MLSGVIGENAFIFPNALSVTMTITRSTQGQVSHLPSGVKLRCCLYLPAILMSSFARYRTEGGCPHKPVLPIQATQPARSPVG